MSRDDGDESLESLLAEQQSFYRAVAPEYHEHSLAPAGGDEVVAALDAFGPAGDVLELACGPGTWTKQLLRHADTVTAVDGSSEMLAIASSRIRDERVRFVEADLFAFRPDRRYDVVFFAFWISHVPPERFDSFWSLVRVCLKPGGRMFFTDDAHRDADELEFGEDSPLVRRRLNDGSPFRVVKVPYEPAQLEARLRELGWEITVTATSTGPFYWGAGGR
jgi:ubiquinone/menaquinone biosynthesis C-methylase UbiE